MDRRYHQRFGATMGLSEDEGSRRDGLSGSPPWLFLEIDVSELLPVVVADDEAGGLFFDRPGRQEAAGRHKRRRHVGACACVRAGEGSRARVQCGRFRDRSQANIS